MEKPQVVILGAGPAGLGAAFQLARQGRARVTVVERQSVVGGNAGSFELAGIRVDYGSHRLHPACDPEILRDLRGLLNGELLDRPRHGRIRLRGRWIHFPLKPVDLCLKLPLGFVAGVAGDMAARVVGRRPSRDGKETFMSVLERGLGKTICRDFYFPYARKLWGLDPAELSATQAQRRVSANSVGKLVRKVLSAVPGLKPPGSGRFFYPRRGYGEISERLYEAACQAGAEVRLETRVESIQTSGDSVRSVRCVRGDAHEALAADYVWSTIPISMLIRCFTPPAPSTVLQAAQSLSFRAMILIYLVLEQDQFSEFDAHYFPETDFPVSRLSEPKNYCGSVDPPNRTVLCAELPCSPDDDVWTKSDGELGNLVLQGLVSVGLPVKAPVLDVQTRRLRQAYPIYRCGYESHFEEMDRWISRFDNLLSFGRQGLFAHDNTHHALYMAYAAAGCLDRKGGFDKNRWRDYRRIFETHVVED